MTRTLASLFIAALALGPTGCLGDDPDHIPTTGFGGGVTKSTGSHPVDTQPTQVLRTELMKRLSIDYAGVAPDQINGPAICGDCSVTVDRHLLGNVVDLALRDDHGNELCHVTGTVGALSVDTCGLFTGD